MLNLHDVDLARRVADRMVGLRAGRLVFDRPTTEVTASDLELLYADPGRALADAVEAGTVR
ncbi:hypothetical protein [Rhodococcus rhodochrous]|uniref:hypothetical protein n=1 Tax=Rhodococcus rhodochrous TaxID=1829 RepID=UPI000A639CDF|nr:hypothetical protein [Rhodococcus rhodochrous]